MTYKNINYRWILVLFLLLDCSKERVFGASEIFTGTDDKTISIEYLSPIEDNRNIETINVDFNYLAGRTDKLNLTIYFGVTGTYANGTVTQWVGEEPVENSAFGIGPGVFFSFNISKNKQLSLQLNGSGNFIIYSERFPKEADYYNFMWRLGPMIEFRIGNSKSIGFGYKLLHVSNGKRSDRKNASYDAHGIAVMFKGFF